MEKLVTIYNLTDHPKSREMSGFKSAKPITVAGVAIPPGSSRPVRESVTFKKDIQTAVAKGVLSIGKTPSWYKTDALVTRSDESPDLSSIGITLRSEKPSTVSPKTSKAIEPSRKAANEQTADAK